MCHPLSIKCIREHLRSAACSVDALELAEREGFLRPTIGRPEFSRIGSFRAG